VPVDHRVSDDSGPEAVGLADDPGAQDAAAGAAATVAPIYPLVS
jgi:hypothetical protein